jgi:dTDP-4-amino-4,6-dideoxygalactose transaminase
MQIPWWQVKFDKAASKSAYRAIKNGNISMGSITEEFESRVASFLEVDNVIAVNSGSNALLLSLLSLDLNSGDEVLIQDRSWIAAAHAVKILGAIPVLVDVEIDRPTISISDLIKKISKKTKAIIVVHMNGRGCDLDLLNKIASDRNITLIEDSAQAMGSKYENRYLGTVSDMGCYSLSVAKIIGSGQGGFIVTNSNKKAQLLRKLRTHGMSNPKEATWNTLGFNFRFSDILASVALSELRHLPERLIRQRDVYLNYASGMLGLKKIKLIESQVEKGEIGPYIEVLVDNRERFKAFMSKNSIDTRNFYPSISKASYLNSKYTCPNSNMFASNGIYLPSGPSISNKEIKKVVNSLQAYDDYKGIN